MLQKKFDTVLESMNLEPLDLQPTSKVADLYQELVNELLKMFSLENYTRKLQDELNVIKEAKEEKLAFLEPAKDHINQFIQQTRHQFEQQKQQLAIQYGLIPPPNQHANNQ